LGDAEVTSAGVCWVEPRLAGELVEVGLANETLLAKTIATNGSNSPKTDSLLNRKFDNDVMILFFSNFYEAVGIIEDVALLMGISFALPCL
jgi:hypothetical protein